MADPRELFGRSSPTAPSAAAAPASAAGNPFAAYPGRGPSPSNPLATVAKGVLGMTGIGMVPLGIWEYQKQKERDERARMGLEMGSGRLAELMGQNPGDPMAQLNAVTQTIREISQQPGMIADNPELIPQLLQTVTQMREAQAAGGMTTDIQNALFASGGDQGLAQQMVAQQFLQEPSALEQEMQLYQQLFGASPQDAFLHASDKFSVAQITDEMTRVTTPILINKVSGTGQVIRGGGGGGIGISGGPTIPAEQIQQMREQGQLGPEQSLKNFMGQGQESLIPGGPTEEDPLLGITGAEAALEGSGAQGSAGRLLNAIAGSFVPGAVDQEVQKADSYMRHLNALAARYTRDEVGSARLAGITELNTIMNILPKPGVWQSQTDNLTKLIDLHDRVSEAQTKNFNLMRNESHSPEARKEAEARFITGQEMLRLIGNKTDLQAAEAEARKNPKGWGTVFAQLKTLVGGAPEEIARARQEASSAKVMTPGAGLDDLAFEDLVTDVLAKIRENPANANDPNLVPDDVNLSEEQLNVLIKAIEGALGPLPPGPGQ